MVFGNVHSPSTYRGPYPHDVDVRIYIGNWLSSLFLLMERPPNTPENMKNKEMPARTIYKNNLIATFLLMVQRKQELCIGGSSLGLCWHDHSHGLPVCSTGGPQSANVGLPGRVVEPHQSLVQELLPPLTLGHWLPAEETQAVQKKFKGENSARGSTV